jgi:hypothetical protein
MEEASSPTDWLSAGMRGFLFSDSIPDYDFISDPTVAAAKINLELPVGSAILISNSLPSHVINTDNDYYDCAAKNNDKAEKC